MGRKKKSLLEKTPVKLRHRKLADGRESLFLDRSVDGRHEYEFLKLYLLPESTALIKRQNAQTLRKAEDIAVNVQRHYSTQRWMTCPAKTTGMFFFPTGCRFVLTTIRNVA